MAAIPSQADLVGLWRRGWIRAGGVEDAATRVLWHQGDATFADLRVPADLPDMAGARALADLDAAALAALARCEGFAGRAAVVDGVCTWTRAINWRGPEAAPDVGRLALTDGGMIETGVHAEFSELWLRQDGGPVFTRRLADGTGRRAFIVWTEALFTLGIGDPATKAGPPLEARLAKALADGDRAALAAILAMEFSHGVFDGGDARVTLSTIPPRVGARPFGRA
ncbi:MAG: hypothetical protein ACK4WC_00770, partial [Rubrimonas sp.]